MNNATQFKLIESQTLACRGHCAAASILVEGLPSTVLVQLLVLPYGKMRRFSLYSVYREDTMTFDAICRFTACPDQEGSGSLKDTLLDYLQTDDFKQQVLGPLIREVKAHFRR